MDATSRSPRSEKVPAKDCEKGKTLFMVEFSINLLDFLLGAFHNSALSFSLLQKLGGRRKAFSQCDSWRSKHATNVECFVKFLVAIAINGENAPRNMEIN